MDQTMEGKIAVVTGASRGIGKAIAVKLASKGATVVINYNGSRERAEEVKNEVESAGGKAVIIQCNVADFDACKEFIETVIKEQGRIDILVNNAGITKDGLLMKMSEEDFDKVLDTNLKGTFHTIRAALRQMIRQRSGRIINMASVVGVSGNAGQANYAASKAGVIGLLGGVPTYPSTKYGYIVPEKNESEPFAVKGFREKPDEATAQELVDMGALWNCGVFCFKLNMAAQWLEKYGVTTNYDEMVTNYEKLPKQSFDYEVLEHWKNIVAVQYDGIWKDLGTWNTLTEEMNEQSIGDVTWDKTCENSHAINVLGVPMVVMGAKNMVIVASHDGILVADKHQSSYIKDCLENIPDESRFEERRWGTIKTIDNNDEDGIHSVTKRIKILAGKTMPYHTHARHTETITVISGMGKLILEGTEVDLLAGSTVSIASGKKHSIKALGSDLRLIEVSLGVTCDDEQVLG